ncbi:c-type cytochrome [Bacillus sp. FJAT-45350]|uniref:c-type cytochrome n=1 Tax=Bacillus sp. FJAT-45350 TaxID=2011014 RepID=UPI000BB78977|nr:cytochrome c [Bacillus sp. FJAT-45350]
MKKFLMAIMGASVLALGACGGGADEPAEEAPVEEAPAEEAPVEEAPAEDDAEETAGDVTYDVASAEAKYNQSCAACHGGNLQGGVGPSLEGGAYTYEEIMHAIENGIGTMPPNLAEGAEAENLSAWLANQ